MREFCSFRCLSHSRTSPSCAGRLVFQQLTRRSNGAVEPVLEQPRDNRVKKIASRVCVCISVCPGVKTNLSVGAKN